MRKIFLLFILCAGLSVFQSSLVNAQGVGINSSGNSPDPSAIIDASSTSQGVLIPRMTTAQRDAISNPVEGLQIYNLDCHNYNYFNGTIWTAVNKVIAGVTISADPQGAICSGTSVTYTAVPVEGGTTPAYQWKVNGSDVGTDSPTYTSTTLNNGDIVTCVLTSNLSCITGSPATSNGINVVFSVPATPGEISGNTDVCQNSEGNVYSIDLVAGATSYNWTFPSGASISSGSGTTSVTVAFGSEAGNIIVSASNDCSITGGQSSLAVNVTGITSTGTVTHQGGYTIHTFNASGTFTPSPCLSAIEVLVLAGGGGGSTGPNAGGGGGAGGLIYEAAYGVLPQVYNISVGAGGNGGINTGTGANGGSSVFGTLNATGGGGGTIGTSGSSGGSGSGAPAAAGGNFAGGSGIAGQGNNGGSSPGSAPYPSAGGGGSGSTGGNGTGAQSGAGGSGTQLSISGSPLYYAAGGGGAGTFQGSSGGAGGSGIGGNGGGGTTSGTNAVANTGSGGGGGGNDGAHNAGNGSSGIVIIRYQDQ